MMSQVEDELEITMDYAAMQAHVPEAERNNCTLKERIRAAYHRSPYRALPKAVMKCLTTKAARKLNYFPNKHGISPVYSPRQIVHQVVLDYHIHCYYTTGEYVQAHDDLQNKNTQAPRTLDCLYMRPTTNGHDVFDLKTKRTINRPKVTKMPITPSVIKAVEDIAEAEEQKGLRIKTRTGNTIYDSSWTAGVDYDEDDMSDDEDYDYESDSDETYTTEGETSLEDEDDEQEAIELLNEDQNQDQGVREHEGSVQEEDESTVDQVTTNPRRSTRERQAPKTMEPSFTITNLTYRLKM